MVKTVVKEYMDYATVHGIGRMKNSPFLALKVLWVLALCGSLGMIAWQITTLYERYQSVPISTSVEIKTDEGMVFPKVTICNTNPVQYSLLNSSFLLQSVLNDSFVKYELNMTYFNMTDPYSEYPSNTNTVDNDILRATAEIFKLHMAIPNDTALQAISQPFDEFMLLCNFAGKPCDPGAFAKTTRTYDYGICYTFDPKEQQPLIPDGKIYTAGPSYALEMLVNVDQTESIPFVTSSTGIVITASAEENIFFNKDDGIFLPTGFEANVGLKKLLFLHGQHNHGTHCQRILEIVKH